MARKSGESTFEAARDRLVGIKPPEKLHRASLARLEAMFERRLKESAERRKPVHKAAMAFQRPFIEQAKQNPDHQRNVKAIRDLAARAGRQKLAIPKVPPVKSRIYTGSINLTATPPYTWPWTWSATNGGANAPSVSADNNGGNMSFLAAPGDNGGWASAACAVGVYVQPMVELGFLQISATPAFNGSWWTYNVFDSSHSDAFIGIYVGAYTLDGGQEYVLVDQQISLWSEDHNFCNSPDNSFSNSGFPLSAGTIVGSQSFYEVWVWCGGTASCDGDHTFWGSWAGSALNVAVPSINMELL